MFDLVDSRGVFSGRDLPLAEASVVSKTSGQRQRLLPVPAAYRGPVVSRESAMQAALMILESEASERSLGTRGPVQLYSESAMYYTFILPVAEWQEAGRIPGGLTCAIDKLDGLVWSVEEQEEYLEFLARV